VTLEQFHFPDLSCCIALASGKTQRVPYASMVTVSEAYVNSIYFPPGVALKEPSRYKGGEAHAILMLWRMRQQNGVVPFKFDNYVGTDKEPEEDMYEASLFEDLAPVVYSTPHDSPGPVAGNSEEEEDSDDETIYRMRRRTSGSSEEEDSDESDEIEQVTQRQRVEETTDGDHIGEAVEPVRSTMHRQTRTALSPTEDDDPPRQVGPKMKRPRPRNKIIPRQARSLSPANDSPEPLPQTKLKPRPNKVIISEEEDEPPQETIPQRPRTRQATTPKANSSSTLKGASGQIPTPDPSQASSPPVPDGPRALRPRAAASSDPAKSLAQMKGKGKVQGGKMTKGKKH